MKFVLIAIMALFLTACEKEQTSDSVQRVAQEAMAMQATASVGMPSIVNFQEKRILKDIIEKRDQSITTITYTQDMNGNLHKLCDSVGFGISAATQFTNPMRLTTENFRHGEGGAVIPQADPNGLFSPTAAEGTWVMCKDPRSDKVSAVYTEPRVIVSPFALK